MTRSKTHFYLAMLLSTFMVVSVQAQDEKKQEKQEEKKQDSAEQKQDEPKTFAEIRTAMAKAQSEALQEYRGAKRGSPEQRAALDRYYGAADKFADKIIEMITKEPEDRVGAQMLTQLAQMTRTNEVRKKAMVAMFDVAKAAPKSDSAFQMLMMLMTGPTSPMQKEEAQTLLMKNFGDSEKMADFAMNLTRARPSEQNVALLRKLLEGSKHDAVKGTATYALGKMLSAKADTKEEGVELIKSIPVKYKDVMVYGGRMNLAKMVEGEIFELERLQIGMEVPDIEGEDVDGVKFKLSDYRGKVVVIDFWGDW